MVVFCLLGILINKRPIGDLVLMVVGALALIATVVHYVARSVAESRREQRAEAQRTEDWTTSWSYYSEPQGADHWVVGIERRTKGGRLIGDRINMATLGSDDTEAQIEAEGQAIRRAAQANQARTG